MSPRPPDSPIEVRLDSPAGGDASVGRTEDGLVVFAEGGLPGEVVRLEVHTAKKRYARGRVIEVVEPSPDRMVPACATARAGCGGCDLAHATIDRQRDMKRSVVADALQRIGRVTEVPEITMRPIGADRYRTTVRAAVVGGRAGYRRQRRHDVVVADECLIAHPAIEELLRDGRWGGATEVTLRTSAASGERVAIVDGSRRSVVVPDDVVVVERSALRRADQPTIVERAAGRDWQISAGSFFQSGPAAASALVEAVTAAIADNRGGHLVDAYSGVGLFSGTIGRSFDRVTAVERTRSAVRDARVNLGAGALIVESAVESWAPSPADVVVADPARAGLGRDGADRLVATGASRFVLASCDPGSLGRDVGLLGEAGYSLRSVDIVDAFPQTSTIETVAALTR